MIVAIEDWKSQKVGELELPPEIFSLDVRSDILARVIRWQLAKRRQGTHSTKGISQVSGTTRKPFRQKGTGNARMGSKRSAQCRGGGIIFGPKPRDHAHSLNKKIRRLGLKVALSLKLREGRLAVISGLDDPSICKTRELKDLLVRRGWDSVLCVNHGNFSDSFARSARNIGHFDLLASGGLNVYSIMQRDMLVLCPETVNHLSRWLVS
jgi:large subunit ribosomal protein L4